MGAIRAITGFLIRERNYIVPAYNGVLIRYTRYFPVRLSIVKSYFRYAE